MGTLPQRLILWLVNFGNGIKDPQIKAFEKALQPPGRERMMKRAMYGQGSELIFTPELGHRDLWVGGENVGSLADLSGRWMTEDHLHEEYFVPIPVKCLGSLMNDHGLDPKSRQALMLKDIRKYNQLIGRASTGKFWPGGGNKETMMTPPHTGYYQLLREMGDAKHILIGYSQGGVVARFLAFLDEYVFQENRILGVITVGSPNYGSPLANPDNRENVADGLLQAALGLFSFHNDHFRELLDWTANRFTFDDILNILERARIGFERMSQIEMSPGVRKRASTEEETLGILLRWFGGLQTDPDNAFFDMNLKHLDRPFSVLSLIHRYPPRRIYHGSVVNGDSSTVRFFRSFFSGFPAGLFDLALHRIRLFGKNMGENLSLVDRILMAGIMRETSFDTKPTGELIRSVLELKRTGRTIFPGGISMSLPPQAHDFIVPCAYQITPPGMDQTYLGNIWNPMANHANGSNLAGKMGKGTVDGIGRLLELMRDRIHGKNRPAFDLQE